MDNIEQERQRFEAWLPTEEYCHPMLTLTLWECWQAAINSRPESRQTEMKEFPAHKMLREYRWLNDAHHTDDINNEFSTLLRQYQELQPLKDLSDFLDSKLPIAPEGSRTKLDEWQAGYAVLFTKMNELVQEMHRDRKLIGDINQCIAERIEMYKSDLKDEDDIHERYSIRNLISELKLIKEQLEEK